MAFTWNPSTGLNDKTQFPDVDPDIRAHLQDLLQQVPSYVDEQLADLTNTVSLAQNGWFKDKKTGLIIQWNKISVQQGWQITFPISFLNACYGVIINSIVDGAAPTLVGAQTVSTTGFKVASAAGTTPVTVFYLAIGY